MVNKRSIYKLRQLINNMKLNQRKQISVFLEKKITILRYIYIYILYIQKHQQDISIFPEKYEEKCNSQNILARVCK